MVNGNGAPRVLESRTWHFRYSRPENALGRSGALDLVRRSLEHSTCLLSPARCVGEVGEEARASTNSRQCNGPSLGPTQCRKPPLPRPIGGAFSCGPATKKNPERFSLGVPELSLSLGSRPYGGVSGDGVLYSQPQNGSNHLCRGMGCHMVRLTRKGLDRRKVVFHCALGKRDCTSVCGISVGGWGAVRFRSDRSASEMGATALFDRCGPSLLVCSAFRPRAPDPSLEVSWPCSPSRTSRPCPRSLASHSLVR